MLRKSLCLLKTLCLLATGLVLAAASAQAGAWAGAWAGAPPHAPAPAKIHAAASHRFGPFATLSDADRFAGEQCPFVPNIPTCTAVVSGDGPYFVTITAAPLR